MTHLACIACSIDPQTTSLLVPLAQAGVIAAPIFLRTRLLAAARRVLRRGPGTARPARGCEADADPVEHDRR